MAKGNHASYAIVGFTVLLGLAAIFGTLVYIGGVGTNQELVYAETYCPKSVSGLSVGSAVNFRGVKIGEVRQIAFVGNVYDVEGPDNALVYILLGFDRNLLSAELDQGVSPEQLLKAMIAKANMSAMVTASGITGLSRIEIDARRKDVQPLTPTWVPKHPYIPCAVSLMDSFSDSAIKVMNQINKMDLETVWSNINSSVEALAHTSESLKVLVETKQSDIDKIAGDVSETMGTLRECASEVRDNPSLLIRERVPRALPETAR